MIDDNLDSSVNRVVPFVRPIFMRPQTQSRWCRLYRSEPGDTDGISAFVDVDKFCLDQNTPEVKSVGIFFLGLVTQFKHVTTVGAI